MDSGRSKRRARCGRYPDVFRLQFRTVRLGSAVGRCPQVASRSDGNPVYSGTTGPCYAVFQMSMCDKVKTYFSILREYKAEIIMMIGFVLTVGIYIDFRNFIADTTKIQTQQTEVLRTIETRLTNLEHRQSQKDALKL